MQAYHDEEWGVPTHDERELFEVLVLEGAQAGLSWSLILRRRPGYQAAFAGFDAVKVGRFGVREVRRLLADPGIVRNQRKIEAAIGLARIVVAMRDEPGGFDGYCFGFVGGRPKHNAWRRMEEIPALTPESQALSKDLQRRGANFVGPTICYAFMQSCGLVNDHLVTCYRYRELNRESHS